VLIALIAFLLATGDSGETTGASVARGFLLAVLLIGSVLFHEIGHAVAARLFKREVKEIVITLVGGHTTFDARNITPTIAGVTAAAGPLANAVLGLIALGLLGFDLSGGAYTIVHALVIVNLFLAAFNALPGTPLDGGSALEAIVWGATGKRATGMKAAAWGGRAIAIAYLLYVLYSNFGAGKTPDMFDLVWAFLILSILLPAAGMGLRAARLIEKLEVMTVGRIMRGAVGVPHDATLAFALSLVRAADCEEVVVLSSDSEPAGHFSLASASEVPPERVETTGLASVTIPIPRGAVVSPTLSGYELLASVREWWGKADALVVVDEGEVVGIVRLAEVAEHLG
jgi:Zn-dependent protease